MLIGYARASTIDKDPTQQLETLLAAGCARIFTDEGVGSAAKTRPQLDHALALIKPGDVLVVWKLDRLGQSLAHLVELTHDLGQRGIGFRALSEAIDTTSAQGPFMLHVLAALADFERSLIAERTRAGLVDAKRRGTRLGRKPKLNEDQIAEAKKLIDAGESPARVAKTVGVSKATLYRAIPAGATNRNTYDLFAGTN